MCQTRILSFGRDWPAVTCRAASLFLSKLTSVECNPIKTPLSSSIHSDEMGIDVVTTKGPGLVGAFPMPAFSLRSRVG